MIPSIARAHARSVGLARCEPNQAARHHLDHRLWLTASRGAWPDPDPGSARCAIIGMTETTCRPCENSRVASSRRYCAPRSWHVHERVAASCASRVHAGVRRFIHVSTSGVYGRRSAGLLDERSPVKPDHIYGVTKVAGEKLAQSYQTRLPGVILRISEAYGPGDLRLLKLFKRSPKISSS